MNQDVQRAAFNFENYKFTEFFFKYTPIEGKITYDVKFDPKGIYKLKTGNFQLTLDIIIAHSEDRNHVIGSATIVANFRFDNATSKDDIPSYFFGNSIAIIYPYIRAFVSNMTTQAQWSPLLLPLLNLSNLEAHLKANTTEEE